MKTDLFITGASGMLGTQLLRRLDPQRYGSITLLSRGMPLLPPALARAGNVRVIRASLHEVERYRAALTPQTRILHLAAVTGKADRPQYFSINTHATGLLIRAAERAGVGGFLLISSIAVSFSDRRGYHYAESKQQAEQLLQASTLRWCILRPTIILGADAAIWKSFLALARRPLIVLPGNGQVRIQPIHVDDMVRLLLERLANDDFGNQLLETGGPEVLTLDDFVQRIHRALGGRTALLLHLPLALLLGPLRLLESLPALPLPVSSGQFASFHNNGIVLLNDTPVCSGAPMLGVDAMLAQLLQDGQGSGINTNAVDHECVLFTRYLTGQPPTAGVRSRYRQALEQDAQQRLAAHDRFDRVLLRAALWHPLLLQAIDVYLRLLRPYAALRRRLVLLLAILETHAAVVDRIDRPDRGGLPGFVFGLLWRSAGLLLMLLTVLPVLLPLQWLLGRRQPGAQAA